ncbi:decaprenyl-phosphate phosphoribosyltransferase [candidate division KSB1 bacterium]|nr:decaprenyl-phosphate phosphoribosyltransferase [candidate division KSB1 bacterium]RQW06833.1 MAG: decaprenyl-phosphate phosphoribosyltransferase [candidate division KSB1 bacterium]
MLKYIVISMRPKQWSKNVLVFAGLLFARDFFLLTKTLQAVVAFVLFSLVAGSVYLFNDIADRKQDVLHPKKQHRPIAAGELSPRAAAFAAFLLTTIGLLFAFRLEFSFGLVLSAYFGLTCSYTLFFKNIIILDVLFIASGFVLRAVGGTLAIQEEVSSWLIICTIFLALFMALGKRRAEIIASGEMAGHMRRTLAHYDRHFVDQLIIISTTACLMAYALYTLDPVTVEKFHTRNLVLTLPFVIYGLFRYLYLMYHNELGESPENAIWSDKAILMCLALYIGTVVGIIYF